MKKPPAVFLFEVNCYKQSDSESLPGQNLSDPVVIKIVQLHFMYPLISDR